MLEFNYCLSVYKDLKWNVPTAEYHIYGYFVIFLPIFSKNWLPWPCPLYPCNQKCLLWIGQPRKPPVISNHILTICCRNSFICIYSTIAQTLSQNQTLQGYVAYNWSYGQFCDFWPILTKIWLPWQRPLDPCNQKCFLWIGRPRKPPVRSNHILAISHRNALYAFITILVPKLVAMPNAPLSLVYGSVTGEFPDGTNPISKPNSAWICCIQLKLWQFLWFFGLFWPKFGCRGNAP